MTQILPGAEPFFFPGNDIGVLAIHGFTGSTQSMRPPGEALAKAGFTVLGPRLTGHGTSPEDMATASYQDWIRDVTEALTELKTKTAYQFVVGLSMGGALTLYLAENHPSIAGIIPINAAIDMPALTETFTQLQHSDTQFIEGIGSDIKKVDITELAYPKTPVKSMGDILILMQEVRNNLSKITVPTLICSSTIDHVVPPENSQEIFNTISSEDKTLLSLTESYHVATLDNDAPLIEAEAIAFIQRISSSLK